MSVDFSTVFTSERLIFEAFDNGDEEIKKFLYHQMAMNPEIKGLDSISHFTPLSRSSYYDQLGQWKRNLMNVVICLKPDNWAEVAADYTREEHTKGLRGTPIGILCLSPQNAAHAQHRRVGMGVSISQGHQGKGYGSEAMAWAVDWAFDYANLHSVFLQTSSLNEKALGAYRKVGFVVDGRDREALYMAGKWYDVVNLSILEQDWRAKRAGEKKAEA